MGDKYAPKSGQEYADTISGNSFSKGKARQLVEDIEKTMAFFHATLEKACECLGITVSGYEEAKTFSAGTSK